MRRWVALAVAVLIASVPVAAGPAAARAGAPDPAQALKRKLRNDHGVLISETVHMFFGKKPGGGDRITGSLQLSPSGPVAADFTWRNIPAPGAPSEKPGSHRVIRVGKNVYYDADLSPGPIPDGKKWILRTRSAGLAVRMASTAGLQPINLYEPSIMKAVLKRSTSKPVSGGSLYRGTMSYAELTKVSKGAFRVYGKPTSMGKISWRLWADRHGLLKRLITTDALGEVVTRIDTRYTDWGLPLVITAPPADEVIDENELWEYIHSQNVPIPPDAGNT